ncbi:GntR family transcriptional regulator [Halothiobacillus sp.]|uniref:GntR family transcriptional regulator n=1 Tax=Halothiobacillus sp. TaxID=1891311 RepID=UPI002AD23B52|nr:GntR family transcriptional regulator [Halothiobacillus sp.]
MSPVPLYTQIKEVLRSRIFNGTYQCHEQMPSESELTKIFGVSRITVRQALDHLQKEGLIFKIHGKGTYVSKPKIFQNLGKLQGFGEAMSGMGYEIVSQVIGKKIVPADKTVCLKLDVNEGELVYEIRRVRYLNSAPLSLDVTYIPKMVGERLIKEDLAHRDIFLILENDYGYSLGQADLQIESILADDVLSALLNVEEGAPILRIERLTFTTDNQPLDFEYLYYRGDALQYRLRIERAHI